MVPEYDRTATIPISALDLAHLKPKKKLSSRERKQAFAQAKLHWEEGQKEEAWKIIQSHGLFRARTLEIRRFLAFVYAERHLSEKSLQQTRILVRKKPDSKIIFLHGTNLFTQNRIQETLTFLKPQIREPGPQATNDDLELYLLYFKTLFEYAQKSALTLVPKVEKVIHEAQGRGQENLVAEATFSLGTVHRHKNPERALELLDQAETSFRSQGQWKKAAKVLDHKAFIHFLSRRLKEALSCYKKEAQIFLKANDSKGYGKCLVAIADLQIELLNYRRAAYVLSKALGIDQKKSTTILLMLIECEWRLGADPSLLLSFLEAEIHPHSHQNSPTPNPSYYFLLSQLCWELEQREKAREAIRIAIDLKKLQKDESFETHFISYLATMQETKQAVRQDLARALWRSRRNPDYTLDQLRRWLSGKKDSPLPRTPFEEKEALRVRSRLNWLLGPLPGDSPKKEWGRKMAKALSRAASQGPMGILPFLRDTYGKIPLALLAQLPGGDWKPLIQQGMGIQEALSLEKGIGENPSIDPARTWKSHLQVSSEDTGLLLCMGSKNRYFRFGHKDVQRVQEFLELLQPILQAPFQKNQGQNVEKLNPTLRAPDPICPLLSGTSTSIHNLKVLTKRFASSELPITIQGETGTGKKSLAGFIHQLSPRGRGPLIFVDCASLQEGLIESELLGHVRGAFTGAQENRPGQFFLSSGGSLVLIQPMALSPRGQRLLLGAIESGGFRPLGGTKILPLNARILCTTSEDLKLGLERGDLLPELFYRLSGVTIEIPSLRNRFEDMVPLIQTMLQEERYPGNTHIPAEVLVRLQRETWPGNLRELRNRIKKSLVLSEGGPWDPKLLLEGRSLGHPPTISKGAMDLKTAIKDFERQSLLLALAKNQGHRERTARALGISRRWLQKRIRDLGL
jgi:DNA-binding NtrC family response regulator/tetratricopeptide (TPR) repeat protein